MKKVAFCCLVFCLLCCGCSARIDMNECMSEITQLYFVGEGELVCGNISVGEREKNYVIDGQSGDVTPFSLLCIQFASPLTEREIDVEMAINENKENVRLYFNPMSNEYINDLGYALKQDDEVSLFYSGLRLDFHLAKFSVDYKEALSIAKTQLVDEIEDNLKNGHLEGECYLKVLSSKDNSDIFWLFTLVNTKNEYYNVLINVQTRQILRA